MDGYKSGIIILMELPARQWKYLFPKISNYSYKNWCIPEPEQASC